MRAARLRRAAAISALAFALVSLLACSGGSGSPRPTPGVTVLDTPTGVSSTVVPSGDPGVTVENAVDACREKNVALLRSFVSVPVADDDIQVMFARGKDVVLNVRTPADIQADRATIDVVLDVQRAGGTERVDRTWQLERGDDGVWRFTALPDCY